MKLEDVAPFVRRDWAAVEDWKRAYWADRNPSMTAGELLSLADALRQHVKALRPEWPTDAQRERDLAMHSTVSEMFRRAGPRRRR